MAAPYVELVSYTNSIACSRTGGHPKIASWVCLKIYGSTPGHCRNVETDSETYHSYMNFSKNGGDPPKSQCLLGKQWVSKPQEKCRVPFILLGRTVQVCGRRHAICHWAQREMWEQIILEASKNWWYFCNGMNPMRLVSYVVPMTRGWFDSILTLRF